MESRANVHYSKATSKTIRTCMSLGGIGAPAGIPAPMVLCEDIRSEDDTMTSRGCENNESKGVDDARECKEKGNFFDSYMYLTLSYDENCS